MELQIELDFPINGSTYRKDALKKFEVLKIKFGDIIKRDPLLDKKRPTGIGLDWIYYLYHQLSATRLILQGAPQRIQWTEVLAWQELMGHKLSAHEIQIVSTIDNAILNKHWEMVHHRDKLQLERMEEEKIMKDAQEQGLLNG